MPDKKKEKNNKEMFLTQDFKKKKKKKERFFLIDYENVNSTGIEGIDLLEKNDIVVIFYSINSDKIDFSSIEYILKTDATVRYANLNTYGKNALDFQLSSYLGYLIGINPEREIFIVSKDQGYKNVDDFWRKHGINIHLISQISEMGNEKPHIITDELHLKLKKLYMKDVDVMFIEDTIVSCLEKNDLARHEIKAKINQILCQKFGSDKTKDIFNVIRPFLK